MSNLARVSVSLVLLAGAIGGSVAAVRTLLPEGRILPGISIEGAALPDAVAAGDDAAIAAFAKGRLAASLARTVEIVAGAEREKTTLGALLLPLDATSTVVRARSIGRGDTIDARLAEAIAVRRDGVDLRVPVEADAAAITRVVEGLKERVDEPASDARIDLDAHAIVADKPGHLLDLDGAIATLAVEASQHLRDVSREPLVLTLPVIELPAHVQKDGLAKIDITTVVGSFETHFGRLGDQVPRAANIENAARKLDGLVLEPGALVSFNAVVGERSEANGFKVAWEIFKGEMRPGVGGGTCQVASTLHAASFFAGIDVIERLPHSRPSGYIPMGLDSTVVFPVVDLKLKNPYAFPIVVHAKVEAKGSYATLKIELLGHEHPNKVTFGRDVVETYPYRRRIEEEPGIAEGKAIKKQAGIRGYRVRRVRTLTPIGGGLARSEITYDFYPPTTEIYLVAPGADPDALPPLPEDVAAALAAKDGAAPSVAGAAAKGTASAVACAGACGEPTDAHATATTTPAAAMVPATPLEVQNGSGVHDAVGDQASPTTSVSITR